VSQARRNLPSHGTVNHSANEYARLSGFIHTNTAENFFSILKRGITGSYHHVSEAHLHRYLSEFDYRYNTRHMTDFEFLASLFDARHRREAPHLSTASRRPTSGLRPSAPPAGDRSTKPKPAREPEKNAWKSSSGSRAIRRAADGETKC
jgi:ISXO2-like transposase domain